MRRNKRYYLVQHFHFSGSYQEYKDDIEQYDDEMNEVYDDMHREVDMTENIPDEINAELRSLKKGWHRNYSKNIQNFAVQLYFERNVVVVLFYLL